MKLLYQQDQWVLGIYDDKNYVLYDSTKPKKGKDGRVSYDYAYYSRINQALEEMARRVADDKCSDLRSWVEINRNTLESLKNWVEASI